MIFIPIKLGALGAKNATEQRFYYKQGFHCSQLNRNKNHVINLLLHEELSWRLLPKLPESISTFRIVQKMWLQWPFFYTCTKRFGIEEVYGSSSRKNA